jgi:pilus assembly protein Flp/PilA
MFRNRNARTSESVDPYAMREGGQEVWTSFTWNHGDRKMMFIRKLIKNNKGATAIEYGLIAALIAVAAITAMSTLGSTLTNTFTNVSDNMKQ